MKRERFTGVVLCLAIVSLVIALLEGWVYYASCDNLFFRVMLALENGLKIFLGGDTISLSRVMAQIQEGSQWMVVGLGYVYGVICMVAPCCTLVVLYRILARVFRFSIRIHTTKGRQHVLVYGDDAKTRMLLRHGGGKTWVLHLLDGQELSAEERFEFSKIGVRIHDLDLRNGEREKIAKELSGIGQEKITKVILMHSVAVNNLNALQILFPQEGGWKFPPNVKVYCFCEEDGISRMMEDYYDHHPQRDQFDLELCSLAAMQVREMYHHYPLHSYYTREDMTGMDSPQQWTTHLLIVGFDKLGQEALLQGMNMGVVHGENQICIDVVDAQAEEKAKIFASRFQLGAQQWEGNQLVLGKNWSDGALRINFHKMDVRTWEYQRFLKELQETSPWTYVVMDLKDVDASVRCLNQLREQGDHDAPVLVHLDDAHTIGDYIDENNATFEQVHLMKRWGEILQLDALFDQQLDQQAKWYHGQYREIQFGEDGADAAWKGCSDEEAWRKLTFSRRNASRAVSNHDVVKEAVLYSVFGGSSGGMEALRSRFGKKGRLLRWKEGTWNYVGSEGKFLSNLAKDGWAWEMARMEHRRWCYERIAAGWGYAPGDVSDERRTNPRLLPWLALMEQQPNTCKYDLIPWLLRVDVQTDKEGEKENQRHR